MEYRGTNFVLLLLALSLLLLLPTMAFGQFEVGGYYTHQTGNNGLNGFSGSVGYQVYRRVILVADGDFLWDNTRLGAFELSPTVAALRINTNYQQFLGGGRVRIIGWKPTKKLEKKKILPFAEVLFGLSRLSQTVRDSTGTVTVSAADHAFTWALGGGVDYTLTHNWLARGNLDFVRTHFASAGQSQLRISIGLAYVF
jgi:hypothetical protein